jgi:predicted nucleotidyltransferase
MDSNSNHLGTTIELSVPVTCSDIFSHSATAEILSVLVDTPEMAYGIRELGRLVGTTHKSVSAAVDDLEAVDLVRTSYDGPKRVVQINTERLNNPDDPILTIPQSEFHEPIRDLVSELTDAIDDICGIILFGSVARGDADRKSDIDCFVLVSGTQATAQQTAHRVVSDLHDRRYDGDRYTFQILVESPDTATAYGDRLQDIFAEGITLRDCSQLQTLKSEVMTNGR